MKQLVPMRTSEIIAKLKNMAAKAGETIYERTHLAATALEDKEWVDAEFGGDLDKAIASLEADCFPELSCAFGLNRLLTILRDFPEKKEWATFKYNLTRLWAEHIERVRAAEGDRPKQERRAAKVSDIEERDTKIEELNWSLKQSKEAIQAKESEIVKVRIEVKEEVSQLRSENGKLRAEIAELRGENKALLRMIEQMRAERQMSAA